MPIYVYRFEDGTEIEVRQDFNDEPFSWLYHPEKNIPCAVKRVPVITPAIFKGSGWARS